MGQQREIQGLNSVADGFESGLSFSHEYFAQGMSVLKNLPFKRNNLLGGNKKTYHRLYSIGDQFVYQIIIIDNASLIHYVVMSSWENSRP